MTISDEDFTTRCEITGKKKNNILNGKYLSRYELDEIFNAEYTDDNCDVEECYEYDSVEAYEDE